MTLSDRSTGNSEEATTAIGFGEGDECCQCWGRWGVKEQQQLPQMSEAQSLLTDTTSKEK